MIGLFGLGRRVCGCLCFLLIVGPLLIVIGVAVLFSATHDTRGPLISQYNEAVANWTNTHRAQFAQISPNIYSTEHPNPLVLGANTQGDILADHDKKIHSYTPLKYTYQLSSLVASKPWSSSNTSQFVVSVGSKASTVSVTLVATPAVTYGCTNPHGNDCPECTNQGGVWDFVKQTCTTIEVLDGFCLKLANSSGSWEKAADYGGYGCGAKNDWNTQSYVKVNPTKTPTVTFSGTITVRSLYDPYVYAAHLTDGSYNFGMTQADKAKTGVMLIIVGGVFIAPAILITVFTYRYFTKKSHHDYHDVHHHHHQGYGSTH